jgi:CheY-like chemotaxis protein
MKLREILVVDDSEPDLLFTSIVLERAGVTERVVTVETGLEALAYLQRPAGHAVDVVLLDINMPEMSGFEFLDAYEQMPPEQHGRAVVVMLTSSPDPNDFHRANAHPCVKGYLTKPISVEGATGLLDTIARLDGEAG